MTDPRDDVWTIAAEILTDRQLEALQLHDRGLSYQDIAFHLDTSRQRAYELVTRSAQKIEIELRRRAAA